MKIENTEVHGFRCAFRAMRNPLDSWEKSDSWFAGYIDSYNGVPQTNFMNLTGTKTQVFWADLPKEMKEARLDMDKPGILSSENMLIGPNDMKLCNRLIKGGPEHRKFMRQIVVWADFTVPRGVWQELDTYKVSTVRNSCSTMHKMGHTNLNMEEDFSFVPPPEKYNLTEKYDLAVNSVVDYMNSAAELYRSNKDFDLVRSMKSVNPEGFLQKATMTFNYETLLNMFKQRRSHRLPEWRLESDKYSICKWILDLPYMKEWAGLFDKEKS